MELEVKTLNEVYKDMARVPECFRVDSNGTISEDTICEVTVTTSHESALLWLRGKNECSDPSIYMDEKTRNKLKLKVGDKVEFVFRKACCVQKLQWALYSSEPINRIATLLGLLGLCLGIISIFISIFK